MRTIRNIFTTTPLREAISKATRLSHTPRSRTNLGVLLLGALTLPLATLGYAQETGGGRGSRSNRRGGSHRYTPDHSRLNFAQARFNANC